MSSELAQIDFAPDKLRSRRDHTSVLSVLSV